VVAGYAATSDFDLQEDIITEEAILASAKDLIENSTVLHNHNADDAIGKVLSSRARKDGLFLKILISKTAPEIWQQITEGVLNKFSVRGKVLQARKQWVPELKRHARLILKMRLIEVSLVAVPANPKARAIRWYIEKALDEFEKAGGEIEASEGGPEMGEERVVDGEFDSELIEAEGDSADSAKRKGGETDMPKGFPSPDELAGQWSAAVEKAGLQDKGEAETFEAWVAFCKQQGYPHPYPYPYPKPQAGAHMRQIVEIVDRMLGKLGDEEKDAEPKTLLQQVRAIAAGAANSSPTPPARKQGDGEGGESPPATNGNGEAAPVEKAGRKIAGARLARLKKLLKELEGLITEVDHASPAEKKTETVGDSADKVAGIEGVVGRIAKALGINEEKDGGDVPDLAGDVKDLRKRLNDLENTPGSKTSLDDEDGPGEGKGDGKSVWKGLL
jgi:HK97 family phage prohead protease